MLMKENAKKKKKIDYSPNEGTDRNNDSCDITNSSLNMSNR